ncbi:MAG: cyclic nucleotide-binding domain-containing protein [Candidatus Brocadia sp. AMX2]|uniref:Transcriptional regulator Crp/Fnr family n=1 Tax=Candidatus Brocadia sinica JPN1 TaxID=1197129 RepID=A0ABQ0K3B2_9BACT|nr:MULTISPECIES: cyclic nucleotide-binding domain-containing protein [Brocadia]KXK25677.1 MAG: cyclic nucleotide-binding protein [Candidatus Brocadia sinica]MBC6932679.1 cyclic nucleotide-binding domain-containing protein [Candidatus Brocadia sp.]MBL1169571.1 cyclic nucleotide-binding domain-containing protein [Candidatus Brocadia sp. AMX1]NOG42997.1 cyclic nucleotide-binding domain-containing protein [Planctomycetota bacterium]KAA0243890.1 MAG: cyclic nucleotide-binding domain-containing prot
MQPHTLEPYLAEHPFLKGLEPKHLKIIVGCASNVRFDAGQFILREGEEANNFYIIRHGKVSLEIFTQDRGPITIQTIGEGEVLGWSWLIPPYHWHYDARALELTRAIALDGKCLRAKCEQDHDLGYELLKRFAYIITQRLEATRLQLLDIYGVHV